MAPIGPIGPMSPVGRMGPVSRRIPQSTSHLAGNRVGGSKGHSEGQMQKEQDQRGSKQGNVGVKAVFWTMCSPETHVAPTFL